MERADSYFLATFNVDSVSPVVFNEGAFDHLVYSERHKELVFSLVESQRIPAVTPEDVIPEKGSARLDSHDKCCL